MDSERRADTQIQFNEIDSSLMDFFQMEDSQSQGDKGHFDVCDVMDLTSGQELEDLYSLNFDFLDNLPEHEQSYVFNCVEDIPAATQSHRENVETPEPSTTDIVHESSCKTHDLNITDVSSSADDISLDTSSDKNAPTLLADKYLEMRRKNNIASQRSRKIRKEKDVEMEGKLRKLIKENEQLKSKVDKLEKERDMLQKYFIEVVRKK